MPEVYDHVVVGAGALGSAAAYWLSRRSSSLLVCEQYEIGHERGASQDYSRIIRHAYHDLAYAVLTQAAYDAYRVAEQESRQRLITRSGSLDLADVAGPAAPVLDAMASSLEAQGHTYERLRGEALRRRFPQWQVGEEIEAIFQADGGVLDIGRANAVHLALARRNGATVRGNTPVAALEPYGDGVIVRLGSDGSEKVRARSVVVAASAWAPRLLQPLGVDLKLTISEEQVTYFGTSNLASFSPEVFPVYIFHAEPEFYGFPVYGLMATKCARDLSGRFTTIQNRTEAPDASVTAQVQDFLGRYLPDALGPIVSEKACFYDLTPDRHFVVDAVPGAPQIAFCQGAGHAAKFAGLLGRIMSELVTQGTTKHPIDPFRLDRPALTDPSFVPAFRFGFATPDTPTSVVSA
jgi:monomeric sarcosine oxidase